MHSPSRKMGSRKGTNAALALVIGSFAAGLVACSAPPSQKTPLIVCEAGEDGCPSDEPKTSKRPSTKKSGTSGPSGSPAPASSDDDDDDETLPADGDAGAEPEPEPEPGPICKKLMGCCDQLKAAGYSDATCLEIVDTRSENACSLQHKQYRDFGDCT